MLSTLAAGLLQHQSSGFTGPQSRWSPPQAAHCRQVLESPQTLTGGVLMTLFVCQYTRTANRAQERMGLERVGLC